MNIVLIAGLWLDDSAWAALVPPLTRAGHRPLPVKLPGQGDQSVTADLDDQIAAVTAAVDACRGEVMVVGHSAAATLAWVATDARPDRVAKVVLIGGFPSSDGKPYADFFDCAGGVMPFPGWQHFEGPDSRDLDGPARDRLAATFVTVPEAVAKGIVNLHDPRRYDVPVVVVCPEFDEAQAREWIAGGIPELRDAHDVSFVDIDSGHWPMFTRPDELAHILSEIAAG